MMFSKSKGNGVDPLEIIEQGYGADALRTYLMFAAPLENWAKWDPQGVPGTHRFLVRLWTIVHEYKKSKKVDVPAIQQKSLLHVTHSMVKKVTEDVKENRYNTAIAACMGTLNTLYKLKTDYLSRHIVWQEALEKMVMCIAPFAPHIADELWHELGHSDSVHVDHWPVWEDKYLSKATMNIVVQVNGKVRAELELASDADENTILKAAQGEAKVQKYIEGKTVKKQIYVAGRLVNLVVA